MSEIKDGGPAFPVVDYKQPDGKGNHIMTIRGGMSLRDYFAAKALPAIYTEAMRAAMEGSGLFQYDDWRVGLALDAYMMADAMLKAREQQ